jgi:deaminated glutathione amidase
MQVVLVQQESSLDPADNRGRLESVVPEGADLVVLPEAWQRHFGEPGFDLAPYAEPLDGPFVTEVERVAKERETTIVSGMFEQTGGTPYNTVVVRGRARLDYRKIHMYDSFGYQESKVLAPGPVEPATFELEGTTFGILTCYDEGAEVILVPAAWVAGPRKVYHWTTLLRARAIENTVFVVGVGQPAPRSSGHSMVIDPLGDVLVEGGDDAEILTAEIDLGAVAEARRTNPSLANRRL